MFNQPVKNAEFKKTKRKSLSSDNIANLTTTASFRSSHLWAKKKTLQPESSSSSSSSISTNSDSRLSSLATLSTSLSALSSSESATHYASSEVFSDSTDFNYGARKPDDSDNDSISSDISSLSNSSSSSDISSLPSSFNMLPYVKSSNQFLLNKRLINKFNYYEQNEIRKIKQYEQEQKIAHFKPTRKNYFVNVIIISNKNSSSSCSSSSFNNSSSNSSSNNSSSNNSSSNINSNKSSKYSNF